MQKNYNQTNSDIQNFPLKIHFIGFLDTEFSLLVCAKTFALFHFSSVSLLEGICSLSTDPFFFTVYYIPRTVLGEQAADMIKIQVWLSKSSDYTEDGEKTIF